MARTMGMEKVSQSLMDGQAWADYCDTLKQAGEIVLAADVPATAFDRAEGVRYLSRLSRTALETFVEFADPQFPVIYRPAHETVKMGADNPDNYYQKAAISGRYRYRVRGQRNTVFYLSFGTQASNYGKDGKMGLTGFLDGADLVMDEQGQFEIIISCDQQPGNWLPMAEDSESLLIRQTFLDRGHERVADLTIECIDAGPHPEPLEPEDFTQRLQAAGDFVYGTATLFASWASGLKKTPNEIVLFDPELTQSVGGDPNIRYYFGYWELADDEALVIESAIPECEYWNIQLNNWWLESLDFRYHQVCLNDCSAQRKDDGSVCLIVSHRDPGLPNWLDTAGHRVGTLLLRWVRASEHPLPVARVVKLNKLLPGI